MTQSRRSLLPQILAQHGIDVLICASNGYHTIDFPNPVDHACGFRSLTSALYVIGRDGRDVLIAGSSEPALAERSPAAACVATDDYAAATCAALQSFGDNPLVASVGFGDLPYRLAAQIGSVLPPTTRTFDETFTRLTGAKTAEEIANARRATEIAEAGYRCLLEWAKPGMSESELVVKTNLYMRELGANDVFTLISSDKRNASIMPSSERILEKGDLVLIELSPSYRGQFVQICRTVSLGQPDPLVPKNYQYLFEGMMKGVAAARPGVTVGSVCSAINDDLGARGFAKYSSPPFIRRRGHGLGSGTIWPGDIAVDNNEVLVEGALFMVHPNQFLPDTGYMMCGEPVLVTATGAEVLTKRPAQLDVISL